MKRYSVQNMYTDNECIEFKETTEDQPDEKETAKPTTTEAGTATSNEEADTSEKPEQKVDAKSAHQVISKGDLS